VGADGKPLVNVTFGSEGGGTLRERSGSGRSDGQKNGESVKIWGKTTKTRWGDEFWAPEVASAGMIRSIRRKVVRGKLAEKLSQGPATAVGRRRESVWETLLGGRCGAEYFKRVLS